LQEIAARLRIDPLQIEPIVERLVALDWVARIDEAGAQRLVLLAEPQATKAALLIDALLLEDSLPVQRFRQRAGLATMTLADLIEAERTPVH
jgi:membrane protein